jgi:hypothetical protein
MRVQGPSGAIGGWHFDLANMIRIAEGDNLNVITSQERDHKKVFK